MRFLVSLTCSVASGAALALLLGTIIQFFFSEPTGHQKAALAALETHWNVEQVTVPMLSEPTREPAGQPKTDLRAANPGLQRPSPADAVRDAAGSGAVEVRPVVERVQAPSHAAPDASPQQNKTAAAETTAQTSGHQPPPAALASDVIRLVPERLTLLAAQVTPPTDAAAAPAHVAQSTSDPPPTGALAQTAAPPAPTPAAASSPLASGASSPPHEALAAAAQAPSVPPS